MKKRIVILLLALVLLGNTASFFVLGTGADAPTPELSIAYCNLSFQNSVCIKYAVKSNVSNVKILIWNAPETEYVVGTQDDVITHFETQSIGGEPHMVFDYAKLTAKQMTDVVYVRAYSQVDGVDYYSEVNKYSILQYAYNKLGKTATASTDSELKEMLVHMLEYGAAAQKYLNDYKADRLATADWYQVTLTAGLLDDGCSHGLYLAGDKVTITAPATNAEGGAFFCWTDETGAQISLRASYELTVEKANKVYTPVYDNPSCLEFSLLEDGTYGVMADEQAQHETVLTIPNSHNGIAVTQILEQGFKDLTNLQSVSLPDGLFTINDDAFSGCSSLNTVVLPSTLTSIGEYAFYNCTNIEEVTIPASVTFIGKYAYYGTSLTSAVFENTVGWKISDSSAAYSGVSDIMISGSTSNFVVMKQQLQFSGTVTIGNHNCAYSSGVISNSTTTASAMISSQSFTVYVTNYSAFRATIHADYYKSDWVRS